jgi:hypothetical protein
MRQARAYLFVVGYFVLLLSAAMIGGSVVRGEMSPWAWTQFGVDARRHGTGDALFGVLLYLAFYSMGYLIPWSVLSFATWSRYVNQTPKVRGVSMSRVRAGVLLSSAGCFVAFIVLLESEIAFLRSLPTELWNGWGLILASAASAFLLLAGVRSLWTEESRTWVRVRPSAEIFCSCPKCGHEWKSSADRLRTHNIVFES